MKYTYDIRIAYSDLNANTRFEAVASAGTVFDHLTRPRIVRIIKAWDTNIWRLRSESEAAVRVIFPNRTAIGTILNPGRIGSCEGQPSRLSTCNARAEVIYSSESSWLACAGGYCDIALGVNTKQNNSHGSDGNQETSRDGRHSWIWSNQAISNKLWDGVGGRLNVCLLRISRLPFIASETRVEDRLFGFFSVCMFSVTMLKTFLTVVSTWEISVRRKRRYCIHEHA